MDVRLEVQVPNVIQRPAVVPKSREEEHKPEFSEKEKQAETQVKAIELPPPRVISREELRQFMIILGATRGSEKILAAMAHDPQHMRDTLLAKRG
jgi:hypothetical protein